ncbi:MAG: histidine phosphatase family protein [Ktedonobacteraceae bacterium]
MTHLYLIRHGQAMNVVQKTIGNTELSPLGVKQAERLRDRLAATGEIAADVLIASTMLRAKQTAEILASALALPVILDSEVEEWRDGHAEEWSLEEYKTKFDAVEFDQKPYFHITPDAENWIQFMLRAGTALNRITRQYEGKTIVIVCHGGIIDSSFISFLGMSTFQFPRAFFNTHNTSITHWLRDSYLNLPTSWILECYNDVMHLRDINLPERIPWGNLKTQPVVGGDQAQVPTEAE